MGDGPSRGKGRHRAETTYKEEHDGTWVVQLVHSIEIGDSVDVADVDDGEVLHLFGDLVEYLVLAHAVRVSITAKSNDDQALVF